MNKNFIYFISIVLIILLGVLVYITIVTSPPSTDDKILEKLNEIELSLDSISSKKDSIQTIIKQTDKQIYNNEKHYEEVVNNIITQSASADSIFSRNYIKEFIDQRVR